MHTRCGHAAIAAMPMHLAVVCKDKNKDNEVDTYKFAHETGSCTPPRNLGGNDLPRTG